MSYFSLEDLYKIYLQHPQVQTDTRKLKTGDLYFALKGPHFNGNLFAVAAIEAGASFAIVDEPILNSSSFENKIIQVEDVLSTLQALAKHHREQFQIPFIAITGSNGKTTTKELVSAVLSSHFITYTTQGNLNNHIGVPLTILSIQLDAQMAVIEMGANHLNEIKSYCEYTLPNFGLINNCGKAHLEGFGSLEGVQKGKGELYDFIKAHHGSLFLNADYDYLVQMSEGADTIISYGHEKGDLTGLAVSQKGMLQVNLTKGCNIDVVQTQLVGDYNLPNVLAAICIGLYFKVPDAKIKAAIENYTPNNSRSQLVKWNNNDVILDAYNANPSSMKVAIDNFANIPSTQKIICLGGMKELGADSMQEHQDLIDYLQKFEWKQVILVGGDFKDCSHPFLYFDQTEEAQKWLLAQQFQQHHILIKGSRGIQMEKIMA